MDEKESKRLQQNRALEDLANAVKGVSESGVQIALSVMYEEGATSLCIQMSHNIIYDGFTLKLKE